MHHVELLWDAQTDAAVREQWRRLAEADLPSLAHHRSPSNAPHVTLAMTEAWPDGLDAPTLPGLPLAARADALTCFGRGPYVLVRTLVVTTGLLALHEAVGAELGEPAREHVAPGRWVPHVTLAHRLDAEQVGRALDLLAGDAALEGRLERARHWDSTARTERPLGHPPAGR